MGTVSYSDHIVSLIFLDDRLLQSRAFIRLMISTNLADDGRCSGSTLHWLSKREICLIDSAWTLLFIRASYEGVVRARVTYGY